MLVNVCFLGKEKKITHVFYLYWFRKDTIIIVDPKRNGIQIRYLQGNPMAFINKFTDRLGRKVVDVIEIETKENLTQFKPMIYNCISVGKKLLGIKGIIFTPEQLRKKILKSGGVSCLEMM